MDFLKDRLAKREMGLITMVILLILFLAVVTTASLLVFWSSQTKDNIVLIQKVSEGRLDSSLPADIFTNGVNDDGRLTVTELLIIRRSIQDQAVRLNPDSDFGGSELDEAKLGF